MLKNWWKFLAIIILVFVIYKGFTIEVPELDILNETIRNLFFHVPMWFSMMLILTISMVYSIMFLASNKMKYDLWANALVSSGILFGLLGLATGMIWGNYTWGTPWPNDPKIHGAAITVLIYFAYKILRNAINDENKRGKIAGVYSLFAFAMLIVFLVVYPRTQNSLHPGAEGNPAFNQYDLNDQLRVIFYPAVIGWFLLSLWIGETTYRLHKKIKLVHSSNDDFDS